MTEEQIKSLKVGDKITVVFVVKEANDAYASLLFEGGGYYGGSGKKEWGLLKHATLVTPPPTFEIGDTVRVVPDPLTGTVYGFGAMYQQSLVGKSGKITGYNKNKGEYEIAIGQFIDHINVHCLELVKKVWKDKYRLFNHDAAWGVDCEDGTVAYFSCGKHPDAKAAAEAECARLNAEWRKQQEGGAE